MTKYTITFASQEKRETFKFNEGILYNKTLNFFLKEREKLKEGLKK